MKATNIILPAVIIAAMSLSACSGDPNDKARDLLNEARKEYDNGDYEKTLSLIDSLRKTCPKAIKEREKALKIFQNASEKLTQKQIAATDSALQQVKIQIICHQNFMDRRAMLGIVPTKEELSQLTYLKLLRDSLQARFDTQCATVRFIRAKRKGN